MVDDPRDRLGAPSDPVEAAMSVEGTVLHREKVVSRLLALISLGLLVFFGAASFAYLRGWAPQTSLFAKLCTYAMVPLGLYVGLTRTVLRTVISSHEIHVTQGLPGRRIPLEAITSCQTFGPGKRAPRGELFSPGSSGVVVEWTDTAGKARCTLIGSNDPEGLLAVIERARRGRTSRVRAVATPRLEGVERVSGEEIGTSGDGERDGERRAR
jgi:hypothetical protein